MVGLERRGAPLLGSAEARLQSPLPPPPPPKQQPRQQRQQLTPLSSCPYDFHSKLLLSSHLLLSYSCLKREARGPQAKNKPHLPEPHTSTVKSFLLLESPELKFPFVKKNCTFFSLTIRFHMFFHSSTMYLPVQSSFIDRHLTLQLCCCSPSFSFGITTTSQSDYRQKHYQQQLENLKLCTEKTSCRTMDVMRKCHRMVHMLTRACYFYVYS